MSTFGNLEIGKTGITAAQLGQTTTGHNIANANTDGYSRQRVEQSADINLHDGKLQGVRVNGIARLHDKFNSERVSLETSNLHDWKTRLGFMESLESIFQDLEGRGIVEALNDFWNAWSLSADQPESLIARQDLLAKSERLIDQIVQLDHKLLETKDSLNQTTLDNLDELNATTKEIAALNKQIHRIESLRGNANDLKDKREELILKLAEKTDINWFYNKQNMIDVQLSAGVALVRGVSAYDLHAYYDDTAPLDPVLGYDLGNKNLLNVTNQLNAGIFKAIFETRDGFIKQQRQKLSQLADSLSLNVNKLHSAGAGIGEPESFLEADKKIPLEHLTLPISHLSDGEFRINLISNSKLEDALNITVKIDAGVDSLEDLVTKINQQAQQLSKQLSDNDKANPPTSPPTSGNEINQPKPPALPVFLEASINSQGQLSLNAKNGYRFIFDSDSSGVLGELGINSFFVRGDTLADFKVSPRLLNDPKKVALGYNLDPGDNRVALAVHDLQFSRLMQNSTMTFDEFYRGIHSAVGAETKMAAQNKDNHQNIYDQYLALKNNVTGVNIDEEMTQMLKYQKAYDASAKYITTIDQMTQSLINM